MEGTSEASGCHNQRHSSKRQLPEEDVEETGSNPSENLPSPCCSKRKKKKLGESHADEEGNTEDGDESPWECESIEDFEDGYYEEANTSIVEDRLNSWNGIDPDVINTEDNNDEEANTSIVEGRLNKVPDLDIITKHLEEITNVQNGSAVGEVNESAGTFEPDDLDQRDPLTGSVECDDGRSPLEPSNFLVSSDLLDPLLKFVKGLKRNLLRDEHGERPNAQLPATKVLRENQVEKANIQFPVPKNFSQHQWTVKSAQRFELGTTGYSYEGQINDNKMNGFGRLIMSDGADIVVGNWEENRLVELDSCKLHYRKKTFKIIKRRTDFLLTMYEKRFLASVNIKSTDQLDFSKTLGQLKGEFFGNISCLEILQNDLKKETLESVFKFESLLKDMTGASADPITRANTFNLLQKYSGNYSNKILYYEFINDQAVPPELKNAATDVETHDLKYHRLNNTLKFLKMPLTQLDLRERLANIYKEGIEMHREMLISVCPSSLQGLLSKLQLFELSKMIYITRADIDVFEHLATEPYFLHHKDHFENVVERFGKFVDNVASHNEPDPSTIIPIMSPLIEYLVRSLWEISAEITEGAGVVGKTLTDEQGNGAIHVITWPYECRLTFQHISLGIQYNFIYDTLSQILPYNGIVNKTFVYEFHVLEQDSSQHKSSFRGLPERYKHLSKGRLVWLYLLDLTIHEVLRKDPKYPYILKQHSPLIQGYVRFIENSPAENHESFRVLTRNVLKLIMASAPYTRVTERGVDIDALGVDVDVLFQHISNASQNIDRDPLAFSNFRDIIAEYNNYLALRNSVKIQAAPGHFSTQLTQIMQTLMRTVESSLRKFVPTSALVAYFRHLNDFLDDFRNIDFLEMWYVKTVGYNNPESLKKIENKLSTGKNCSYRVINIEKFVAEYCCAGVPLPCHYIILIIDKLLVSIQKCLDKQWQSEASQLEIVQLKTAGILMDAIRRSFMYLKEQPDYVDFGAFMKESVEPFAQLVEECSTLHDMKTRADIVKESFWYLRKMDEIDIDRALTLLREVNTGFVSSEILNCYNLYLSNYNKYIEKYTSLISAGTSHTEGLDAVKLMLAQPSHLHFSQWTQLYKTKEIPILLAGLSAIWSISVSKDLSGTGKFLKPHCIQILCILQLLGVWQSKGIENHLAQVLTGQGKSVILGLLASILALTGHKVKVLCYSKYLSSRDQTDFEDFFRTFHIPGNINYGTFQEMANEILNPTINGRQTSLRQLFADRVLHHQHWLQEMGSVSTDTLNTVLLIDEVDVFFTEHFYGNSYLPCVRINFKGLVPVQEYIWDQAKTRMFSIQQIVDFTKAFIEAQVAAGNNVLADLNHFISTPGTYSLLATNRRDVLFKKFYSNQTLFYEHLWKMAADAVEVANNKAHGGFRFSINTDGIICVSDSNDIYSEEMKTNYLVSYLNTFYYFRIKKSNYDNKDFQNYGYLNLKAGIISYSLLPSQFPLILGVSGTLKNLGYYEKSGIKSYNIRNTTILPSFYGETNLRFNERSDFHYYHEELDWLRKIYYEATSAVQSDRAALIFFESEVTLALFTNAYRNKFVRLNEITPNTPSQLRDLYIEEAGLPGAVTLATRSMGRGVDYKSSLSVEKHGGVHVIQTFFSTDIKEEIQIKGRTARKDNKGSYEMVICRNHLVKGKVIHYNDFSSHGFATLDEIRKRLSHKKGLTVNKKIKESERGHYTTMEFFGLA